MHPPPCGAQPCSAGRGDAPRARAPAQAISEVKWGGDTTRAQGFLAGAEMMPRASFDAYAQLVELRCVPWSATEESSADGLQVLLGQAMLLGKDSPLSTAILVQMNRARLASFDSLKTVAAELNSVVQSASQPVRL